MTPSDGSGRPRGWSRIMTIRDLSSNRAGLWLRGLAGKRRIRLISSAERGRRSETGAPFVFCNASER